MLVENATPEPIPPPPAPPRQAVPPAAPAPPERVSVQPRLPDRSYPASPRSAVTPQEMALFAPPALPTVDFVSRAEKASASVDDLMRRGLLATAFVGTGMPGEMVEVYLESRSNRPMKFDLVPGMILRPPDPRQVQPLLLDSQQTVTLNPGEMTVLRLPSYCMNSQAPAPPPGLETEYRFKPESEPGKGPEAVRVLQAYQTLQFDYDRLPPYAHRLAVVQVAIWKSLRQPVHDRQLQSVLGALAFDRRVRSQVLRDADRVLTASRR